MAKRGYKLQEFVAHTSNVNCLKIGTKSRRVFITGGEDHRVNLWAIGRPNSLLSLSGHTSPVESVTFDSAEVLAVSGTSSGAIKLWDLEEAKIVRTITGHRTNCTSVEFHPFGEFFASGSLDTNLKIWDIRRKGCIHTYKGHTRGISTIRFTPDGRWVVSGGEDNVVKIWDLTAGKLLHDFKVHEGQIRCIDFHPHEFLLATGSADRTVKFWDLETFELIGSAGPEATGVRSMIFHPDGRTLFCGLDESLKVFSWEPIRCHDAVDIGWSTLGDLSIHEGKLLGCSYHQSCVAVWIADISLIGPYAVGIMPKLNGHPEPKCNLGEDQYFPQLGSSIKSNMTLLTAPHDYGTKVTRSYIVNSTKSSLSTPPRIETVHATNEAPPSSTPFIIRSNSTQKNPMMEVHMSRSSEIISRSVAVPVIVPRSSPEVEKVANTRKDSETILPGERTNGFDSSGGLDFNSGLMPMDEPAKTGEGNCTSVSFSSIAEKFERILSTESPLSFFPENHTEALNPSKGISSAKYVKGERTRSLVERFERRERCNSSEALSVNGSSDEIPGTDVLSPKLKGLHQTSARDLNHRTDADDEDVIGNLMKKHDLFLSVLHSRLTKLQVVLNFWQRNDIKGSINAVGRLADQAVQVDVISALMEKIDIITLDLFSCLLPLLTGLLDSKVERCAMQRRLLAPHPFSADSTCGTWVS
ncbi:katanin p80 WD40 repeat-containing subunit B1 homolog KTN80.3-like isoform X2 [Tasmannia lanceolata]|uniref:katanin p80 WD40 repeat-containing subunit B1 homolog KTN80.3-like isoform X2 n=1 Tax=Tasmannia lanceolata TaxID=3420 RepID=UPI004063BEC1